MQKCAALLIGSALFFLGGCAPSVPQITMEVRAYSDPQIRLETIKSFATCELGLTDGNLLLEKELLVRLRSSLEARGLVFDTLNPEVYVGISGYCGSFTEYVPPQTTYFPIPNLSRKSTTISGWFGGNYFRAKAKSRELNIDQVPVTREGYTRKLYYRNLRVYMAKVQPSADSAVVCPVWNGEAESEGVTGDLLIVAPAMFREITGEFPTRTRKLPRRLADIFQATTKSRE